MYIQCIGHIEYISSVLAFLCDWKGRKKHKNNSLFSCIMCLVSNFKHIFFVKWGLDWISILPQLTLKTLQQSAELQPWLSPIHNLPTWNKKENHFRSALRPWCLVTTETTNLCTLERKKWKERGGGTEDERELLVALCIAIFRCREREERSSQDLNVLIIHEVVLRYANMNYLTSRADLLLCLTLSLLPPYLCTSSHSLILSFLSIPTLWLKIRISSQNSIFFLEPSLPE